MRIGGQLLEPGTEFLLQEVLLAGDISGGGGGGSGCRWRYTTARIGRRRYSRRQLMVATEASAAAERCRRLQLNHLGRELAAHALPA